MKGKKKTFLLSFLSLLMSVSMLIGTTFAWFTDSASTGVNTIVAGNLDVEVEYSKDGTTWGTIEGTSSLFSSDLWEPGHTEVVYLKVQNVGTLGFNYKVLVTPVSENGGVNVKGENFKLSDYLVFGTTAPSDMLTTYTRDTARTAVGTTTGLTNVNNLTKTSSIEANGAEQYLALVVYMPETIGNDANYKSGTTAPAIELGIKVVATQLASENDSFGPDYDDGAVDDSVYAGGAYYDYFEAVNVTTTAGADGNFTVTKSDSISGIIASASGTAAAGSEVNLLVMKSSDAEQNFTIRVEEGHELNGYEIKVTGQTNGSLVQGSLYVGTGLENFKFYHNNSSMTVGTKGSLEDGQYYYDTTEGYVYFASTTFSPFQATYKAPVASITNSKGTAVYGTLAEAFKAVKANDTIILLKNSKGNGIVVPSGSIFTVDFNGYTYDINGETVGSSGTETNGFQLLQGSTITFKNGNLTSSRAMILIQNYSNLTLQNMNVSASYPYVYVVSNNNGDVVIDNTTITAPASGVAFDVCGYADYEGPEVTVEGNSVINGNVEISESNGTHRVKLTVLGGTFYGEIYKYGNVPNFVGNVQGGLFAYDPSDFVADGKMAVQNSEGMYEIIDDPRIKTEEDLTTAVEVGGEITLGADITLTSTLKITKDVTLNLGTYKLINNSGNRAVMMTSDNTTVTVNATTGGIDGNDSCCIYLSSEKAQLNIDGGVYSSSRSYFVEMATWADDDVLTIKDVTYTGKNLINIPGKNSTVTMTGGTLTCNNIGINFGTSSTNSKFIMTGGEICNTYDAILTMQAEGNAVEISGTSKVTGKFSLSNGTMTVTGGEIHVTGSDNRAFMIISGATLNVSGSAYVQGSCLFNVDDGCTVNITGGTFSGKIVNGLNYGNAYLKSVKNLLTEDYQLSDLGNGIYQVVANQ